MLLGGTPTSTRECVGDGRRRVVGGKDIAEYEALRHHARGDIRHEVLVVHLCEAPVLLEGEVTRKMEEGQ